MYKFAPAPSLSLDVYPPPEPAVRTGPPLTQGSLFTLVSMVAADACSPEALDALSRIDPEAWYHGQLLESLLAGFERQDPELPRRLGRDIYFMLRDTLEGFGLTSAESALMALPELWVVATRGDSGLWRAQMVGPRRARIEAEQPYHCGFEEGAVRGLIESFGARNVAIAHEPCMRRGAPCCALDVRWEE